MTSCRAMRGCDEVFLFAANPDIARAVEEPGIDFWQGTFLTHNVIEAARITGVRRIIYSSGSGVYGDRGDEEVDEDFGPLIPVSTYGASKLACEAMLAAYAHMFGIDAVRFPLRQRGRRPPDPRRHLRLRAPAARRPDPAAHPRRRHPEQVLHPRRRCGRGDAAARRPGLERLRVYNAGTGDYITVAEIAELVVERMGLRDVALRVAPAAPGLEGRRAGGAVPSDRLEARGWRCRPQLARRRSWRRSTPTSPRRPARSPACASDPTS